MLLLVAELVFMIILGCQSVSFCFFSYVAVMGVGVLNSFFFHCQSSIVQNRTVTEAQSIPADAYPIESTKSAAWNSEFTLA